MMNSEITSIYTRLIRMRLTPMADCLQKQELDPSYQDKSFLERITELVDVQEDQRKDSRRNRLLRHANLPLSSASINGIRYDVDRTLDSAKIREFSTCEYIRQKHNIILQGACGSGKTYIACALASEACSQGYTVSYYRLEDLIQQGLIYQHQERFSEFIKIISAPALLVIDEVFARTLDEDELYILFEIVSKRHQSAAMIMISQYDFAKDWSKMAPDGTLNESMMDRLINNSYCLTIMSKVSMRSYEKPL